MQLPAPGTCEKSFDVPSHAPRTEEIGINIIRTQMPRWRHSFVPSFVYIASGHGRWQKAEFDGQGMNDIEWCSMPTPTFGRTLVLRCFAAALLHYLLRGKKRKSWEKKVWAASQSPGDCATRDASAECSARSSAALLYVNLCKLKLLRRIFEVCSLHIVRQGSQCTRSSRQSLHWALALQDFAGLARPTALCSTEPGKSMNIPFFPFIYSNFNRLHTRSSALSFYPAICNKCKTFKVDFHFPRHHSCLLTVVKCSLP